MHPRAVDAEDGLLALDTAPEGKRPAACTGCRSCEAVCPQQTKISEALAEFARRM